MDGNGAILTWTPANWITVLVMVALGFAILGAGVRVVRQFNAKKS